MKKYLFFAAAAVSFAACTQDTLIDDTRVPDTKEVAIGFGTGINNMTRAENSTTTTTYGLEKYYDDFNVWGYKVINGTAAKVFDEATVTYDETKDETGTTGAAFYGWTYSPVRYWDKAATEYYFYAYSPAAASDVFDDIETPSTDPKADASDKYLTILSSPYALVGSNASTEASTSSTGKKYVQELTKTGDFAATSGTVDYDLMIAEQCKYPILATYPKFDKVNLDFIHILSRMNIAVHKAKNLDANTTITLNELEVVNMQKDGKFDESLTVTPNCDNNLRWATKTTSNKTLTYDAENAIGASGYALTEKPDSKDAYDYILQSLVIPQNISAQDVNLDGTIDDGTGTLTLITANTSATTTTNEAYIRIKYTLTTTDGTTSGTSNDEEFEVYYNLAKLFNTSYLKDAQNRIAYKTLASGIYYRDAEGNYYNASGTNIPTTSYVLYDGTDYYLADGTTKLTYDSTNNVYKNPSGEGVYVSNAVMVTKDASDNLQPIPVTRLDAGETTVDFCEGWQNNLYITISPSAIVFDADVYEWVTKHEGEYTIE